jgi:hypothetical protein
VVRADVPQYTVEPVVNPVPVTVSVKAAPLALVNAGEIPLISGVGFGTTTTWLTEFEELPMKFESPP